MLTDFNKSVKLRNLISNKIVSKQAAYKSSCSFTV
jgi:hypothetical protein